MNRLILVSGLMISSSFVTMAQSTTSSVYEINDGRVVFPDWDSRNTTGPVSLVELGVGDFPGAVVYAERLLLTEKPAKSKSLKIPDAATTFTVTARSRQAGDIFPRIRITLLADDGPKHELFNCYWQSVPLETYEWPVPAAFRGNTATILFEILNPGIVEEQRCWYFLRANVY